MNTLVSAKGEWYRLFTAGFLHGGPLHLLGNMLSLYWMGPPLERLVGPHTFAVIYATSIVSGGLLHFWLGPPFSMALGSSGEGSFMCLPHSCGKPKQPALCQAAFCTSGWAFPSAWHWGRQVRGAVCCQVPKVLAALPLHQHLNGCCVLAALPLHQHLNDCCFMQPDSPLPFLTAVACLVCIQLAGTHTLVALALGAVTAPALQ